ncbi:uncharacterized protein LOC143845618 isoform X2 [Tasmannia lanceolata]|uniref:uncharacterized protein LOC143845618 isoform X2 n=1 Tax=Tasmannia lanceolata TaxID=3420 RepID=UPI004064B0FB
MATTKLTTFSFYFLLLLFFTILMAASLIPGFMAEETVLHQHWNPNLHTEWGLQGVSKRGQGIWKKRNSRRLMIGSTAPTCTYNECRGCKFKCRAEQIPVDANDPINSAYHYRCVCHR